MTIKTWRAEFMPKMPTKKLTKRQAVEHSLRKWEGLTKKNLKKHGVFVKYKQLRDNDMGLLRVDDESCSLCVKYLDFVGEEQKCNKCPLAQTLGNKPCDDWNMPYAIWALEESEFPNPLPMIKALRKTLENLED